MTERTSPTPISWDAPFWQATAEGRFVAQKCSECGRLQHYPRPACIDCLSQQRDWITLSGLGRVWSFSIVRQTADPAFADEVPFILADIELEEGLRVIARMNATAARIGDQVRLHMERSAESRFWLPYFEHIDPGG